MGTLLRSTTLRAYGLALLTVGLVVLLTLVGWPLIQEIPLIFFFVAVLLSAWYGGLGPGLLATLMSAAVLASCFLAPFSAWGASGGELLRLGVFVGVALLLCFLSATQQQAEAARRESEERYRALFENANDAIVTFTLDGIVTSVNRGLEAMLGWSREDLIGQHYRKFVTPASVAQGEERTRRFVAGEQIPSIFEGEQLGKDGRVVPVEARTRPIRDRMGQVIGFQGIYRDITARKQAEEDLRRSAAHFRALVEHALDFVVVLNRDGTVRYESPAVARMLGYTPQEREGRSGFEHLHPDDVPRVRQTFARIIALPGATVSLEFRGRHKDGAWRTLEAVGTNLLDDPVVAGVVVNYRDITEHKRLAEDLRTARDELDQRVQERTAELIHTNAALRAEITARQHAEAELRESEARLQAILDNTPALIYLKDLAGRYLLTNRAHQLLTHTTRAQVKGKTDYELFPPERAARFQRNDQAVLASGTPLQFEEVAAGEDGLQTYLSEKFLLHDTAGGPYAVCGISVDITERKRLEAALQEERNLLEVTLASIGDAVIATDATARLTFINPMAQTLTGWPAQEALGCQITEVFPLINEQSRQPVDNPVDRVLREGKVVGLANHTLLLTRNGREVPIADSGAPIQGSNGQLYGTVLVFRDITESKHAEAALIRAKEAAEAAERTKSEFLATMSHELRTPLNVILGYTDMLIDGGFGELPTAQVDILRRIDRNSRVLFELISMVLDLNRLEAGRLPVDVKEVRAAQLLGELKAEMQGLCEQSGLAHVWQGAPGLPLLYTDPGKLKVVLKNLVSNAVKFTKEGSVTVEAQMQRGGVEFRVRDTGIGIPADALSFIFEPFRQVDSSDTRLYSGSGLGLHIVQRLLGLLGGTITVESVVGQGSTFRVWLPIKRSAATA